MIKPILNPLSFSFVTFACAAIISASEQGPLADRGAATVDSARAGCATPSEIDLGWEDQQQQLEKRLAFREAEGLVVPGAIITPPFEAFAPYRTDVPPTLATTRPARLARRHSADPSSRD